MVNKAEQFVENFTVAMKLMMENAPSDLSICLSIYARDISVRTPEQPDGETAMSSATRSSYFDQVLFKEYVNRFYSKIWPSEPM